MKRKTEAVGKEDRDSGEKAAKTTEKVDDQVDEDECEQQCVI